MNPTEEIVKAPAAEGRDTQLSETRRFCPSCNANIVAGHNFCGICGYNITHAAPEQQRDPLIGAVVGGRYRLLAKIGSGGMGAVYKVEHVRMGKLMAMKILHGDLSRDENMTRRFNREARAVSRLVSRNTVQVFDYGRSDDGLVYLVMEYLRGRDFGDLLTDIGPLSLSRCAEVVAQIARSLSEAHDAGIIHRDIKPENIFLCAPRGGEELIKVLDFGLAKMVERGEEASRQTQQGSIMGTPYYMSPEQIRGDLEVAAASDIYNLGAVIFHLVTGEPPYMSQSPMGILASHLNDPVPLPSERVPERATSLQRLDPVIVRAMAKSPTERYVSVRELAEELASAALEPVAGEEEVEDGAAAGAQVDLRDTGKRWSGVLEDAWPDEGDDISTREDWERYELSLRVKGWGQVLLFIALLVGGVAGFYWGVVEENFFRGDGFESEPNDRVGEATRLFLDAPMEAAIGLPAAGSRADVDFFEIRLTAPEGERFSVEVSGVEGLDLVLEVHDFNGERQARANASGPGGGERVDGLQWRGAPLYASVREVWIEGIPARSAPEAPYTIRLTTPADLPVGLEREPNDLPLRARPLDPGATRVGYLSHVEDLDLYVLPPIGLDGQLLTVTATAPASGPLVVQVVNAAGAVSGVVGRVEASSQTSQTLFIAPVGPQPLHLGVRPAPVEGRHLGSTEPYAISYELSAPGPGLLGLPTAPSEGGAP